VSVGDVVDADVGELGHPVEVADVHPGLLADLSPRCLPGRLARIEVPSGLQPGTDLEVPEQDDASWADDEPRAGDVNRVCMPVERFGQPVDLGDEPLDVAAFLLVDRCQRRHCGDHLRTNGRCLTVGAHDPAPYRAGLGGAQGARIVLGMSSDAAPTTDTLVGIEFPDVFRAQEFLTAASRLAARGDIELRDAVIVISNAEGRVIVRETRDLQTSTSAASGAIWAGLFGLILGGPVGWIAGTAVGAAGGAITAKVVDHGIPDEWVDWFRQAVRPGASIVAVLVGDARRDAVFDELTRFEGARLVYANVPPQWQSRIRGALGEPSLEVSEPASGEPLPPPEAGTAVTEPDKDW
jgi:uncharacterized membrane protein